MCVCVGECVCVGGGMLWRVYQLVSSANLSESTKASADNISAPTLTLTGPDSLEPPPQSSHHSGHRPELCQVA